jgi:hypothetical protein
MLKTGKSGEKRLPSAVAKASAVAEAMARQDGGQAPGTKDTKKGKKCLLKKTIYHEAARIPEGQGATKFI